MNNLMQRLFGRKDPRMETQAMPEKEAPVPGPKMEDLVETRDYYQLLQTLRSIPNNVRAHLAFNICLSGEGEFSDVQPRDLIDFVEREFKPNNVVYKWDVRGKHIKRYEGNTEDHSIEIEKIRLQTYVGKQELWRSAASTATISYVISKNKTETMGDKE